MTFEEMREHLDNDPLVIVVDLDGTLYDSRGREHLAQNKHWDDFHRASAGDPPNMDVLKVLTALPTGRTIVIGCTGRNEEFRGITETWLTATGAGVMFDEVLMRPEGNYMPDNELKPMMISEYFGDLPAALENVTVILEDREKVVDAWRALGFPCWQVRPGGY